MEIKIAQLQRCLDDACASGEECGCQLAIYRNGRLEADLCAGTVAPGGAAVTPDTLFPVFSVGKGVAATILHGLHEKKRLDYEANVADYWPEFAANGKARIKVWHVLTHRAGLFRMPELDHFEDQADWTKMCRLMAAARPETPPGGVCRYHGVTFAWLAGETAARAAGKPFAQLLREAVTAPLGIGREWFFGIDDEAEKRFTAPVAQRGEDDSDWRMRFASNPVIRRGCIPSANGIGSARALAKVYAALLPGGVDGVRLLEPETVEFACRLRRSADDPVQPGDWAQFGLGYVLAGLNEGRGRFFGHGGALGSEAFADRETGLAIGFTKNKFNTTHPVHPLRDRIAVALGLPVRHW